MKNEIDMASTRDVKKVMACFQKAELRYDWYSREYPQKEEKDRSKRWWDALNKAAKHYDFYTADVYHALKKIGVNLTKAVGYNERSRKQYFGVDTL